MTRLKAVLSTACTFIAAALNAFAQAGALDPTFDPGSGTDGAVWGIALQPDGKIIAVGTFTQFNGFDRNGVVRLTQDGSVDRTFDPGSGASGAFAVAVRNQKIVIGGTFSTVNGEYHPGIARLNFDGSVDSTFHGSGACNSVGILSDDKVVIGGVGGYVHHQILRFLPNGDIDDSFTVSVDRLGEVYCVAIQPDDKTLFGGSFMEVSDEPRFRIARADVKGSLDETFLPEGGSSFELYSIALREDAKIYQGSYIIARINSDGSIDDAFEWSYFDGGNGYIEAVGAQGDGKPVVGGAFNIVEGKGRRNYVVRFNNDGSLDENFGAGETLANNAVEAIAIQPDGRILVGGFFTEMNGVPRAGIARLLGDTPVLNTQRGPRDTIINSWPAAYTNWVLQETKHLKHDKWKTVRTRPVTLNGINYVTDVIHGKGNAGKFYRLAQP